MALAVALLAPLTAGASEGPPRAQDSGVVLTRQRVSIPYPGQGNSDSLYLWTWSAGRRGYSLTFAAGDTITPIAYSAIAATDLETGEVVETVRFPASKPAWAGNKPDRYERSMPSAITIDEDGGRLFVAYTNNGVGQGLATQRNCQGSASVSGRGCVGGFHVYDARTLTLLESIPLRLIGIDGAPIFSVPNAVTYVPPTGARKARLLALMEDVGEQSGNLGNEFGSYELDRRIVVQIDPESGRQDWAVAVRECRGERNYQVKSRQGAGAILATEDAIWVGCPLTSQSNAVAVRVPVDEHGNPLGPAEVPSEPVTPNPSMDGPPPAPVLAPPPGTESFVGPAQVAEFLADQPSGRLVFRVIETAPPAELWVVFDTARREYIGRIGTGGRGTGGASDLSGAGGPAAGASTIDPRTGRLYVYHNEEGLYAADLRRTPLPQAELFADLAGLQAAFEYAHVTPLSTYTPDDGVVGVLVKADFDFYRVVRDHRPLVGDPSFSEFEGRTLDIEEAAGVTATSLDGAARGFGARLLLQGGAGALARARVLDPAGLVPGTLDEAAAPKNQPSSTDSVLPALQGLAGERFWRDGCSDQDREIVLGFVGPTDPAVMDNGGTRGAAAPVVIDGRTMADIGAPASRCARRDWDQLWATALFGRAPIGEPGVPASALPVSVACVRGGGAQGEDTEAPQHSRSSGDPSSSPFFARAECTQDEASGFAYARASVGEVHVGEALSSYRIYRDPGRGIVSRVESVSRGISIAGQVTIDTVRGVAESWANGRRQPVLDRDRPADYDPNCDVERTAGTCFRRHIFGFRTPFYSCGPCGDERAFVTGMQQVFGADARIQLRDPDPVLAAGSENGFIAAVVKDQDERFADLVFNGDLVPSVVPTLEIVRYADPGYSIKHAKSGRQIYQFAGVEVSSSYSIQCLLVYDVATNTCAAATEPPASLTIELHDLEGRPLAGGAFEVRADVDGDGVLGLADTLVPEGACVTTDDAVGTCSFTTLEPGSYLVAQVAAPPGYAPAPEPFAVALASGEARTVTFTNGSALSRIDVTVQNAAGAPLGGARFAVYPDPDADGKVADGAQPAATCDTTADGTCVMSVPPGSYVLVQTAAPDGLEPVEAVSFAITAAGQVAAVDVVNYPPLPPDAPPPAAGPTVTYEPPPPAMPPELHTVPLPTMGIPEDTIAPPVTDPGPTLGGTVQQVIRAPGDALRLLARRPMEGIAFAAALALLALAWAAVDRRRTLLALTEENIR